jgi:hypothetical protein
MCARPDTEVMPDRAFRETDDGKDRRLTAL